MKSMVSRTCVAGFLALLLSASSVLAQGEDLSQVLKKPAYNQSWKTLMASKKSVDSWLKDYARTYNGPTSPGVTVQLSDGAYQIYNVCKTHDCGSNMFFVLFSAGGSKAWGLLLRNETEEIVFGQPDEEKLKALRAARNR